jgi:hypothetical protein
MQRNQTLVVRYVRDRDWARKRVRQTDIHQLSTNQVAG